MGYTGYTIEEIEAGIIATLEAYEPLNYVRTFDRLPWHRADELEKLVKRYPATLVAYIRGADFTGNVSVCDHTGVFGVLCCGKNLRSPSAALTGPEASEKGVYDMLDDVLSCLNYSDLGLNIMYCKSLRIVPLAASPSIGIFSREFEIKWRLTAT